MQLVVCCGSLPLFAARCPSATFHTLFLHATLRHLPLCSKLPLHDPPTPLPRTPCATFRLAAHPWCSIPPRRVQPQGGEPLLTGSVPPHGVQPLLLTVSNLIVLSPSSPCAAQWALSPSSPCGAPLSLAARHCVPPPTGRRVGRPLVPWMLAAPLARVTWRTRSGSLDGTRSDGALARCPNSRR